ncbi:sensor histidine kinase [Nitrosomonas sp.]|uniref:sensor histidine kinase n=1 Tax=Nitrosomonas sp. TaxID=42353 RepID=UPI001D46EF9B|nr:ATP-binding protein [Nitrosomonas sp.]MBX3616539.1 hypothetical protein [Nitrosomonas sp.]
MEGKALLFETRIEKGIEDTRALSLRPFIVQFMVELNEDIENETARNNLTRNVNSLAQIGFSAAVIYDRNNNVLSQVGTFSSSENPVIPLDGERNVKLIWDNTFILQTTVNVFYQGHKIGKISTEVKLPNLTRSFMDIRSAGSSAELLICAKLPHSYPALACLIRDSSAVRFSHISMSSDRNEISPKELALSGKSGVVSALDYRNIPVIEAFTSLPTLGLLMTLKLNQEELFMPVNDRLKDIILYLVAMIFAEILLLNWFIRKLISSEKEARQTKIKAEEYSTELAKKEKELRERLKEMTCLYEIRRAMELEGSIDGVCQKILKYLDAALQSPDTSASEIVINDKRYVSSDNNKKRLIEADSSNIIEIFKPARLSERKVIFNSFVQSDIYIDHENKGYIRVYYEQDVPDSRIEEQKLIDAIASDLESWIEFRRLEEALVSMAEGQVHKIGQELHDNIGQQIAAVAFQAGALELQASDVNIPRTQLTELAASIVQQTQDLVINIKQLSKVLLPFELEANGLITALQTLATRVSATYNINCQFENDLGEEDLGSMIALSLYRVAQEAVNNAISHGKAKYILISLGTSEVEKKMIHLMIRDDGYGFDESHIKNNFFSGMGIKIMHYRAKQLNGKLTILKRNESGIEVHFMVPLDQGENA